MKKADEIDLTGLSEEQTLQGLSDMLLTMLAANRCAVVVARDDGALTFLNPMVLQSLPPDVLAPVLLESWSEDQVLSFLEHLYG
jgi:hypothetical protein